MRNRTFLQHRSRNYLLGSLLSLALVTSTPLIAHGDVVDEALVLLNAAESQMAALNEEYETLSNHINELQQQIDEAAAGIVEAQQAVLDGQAALTQTATNEYKASTTSMWLSVLLGSQNLGDFLRNIEYYDAIMNHQSTSVAEQQQKVEAFKESAAALDALKNEEVASLERLNEMREEAALVVSNAEKTLENAKAEEAARVEALRVQAAQMKEQSSGDPNNQYSNAGGSSEVGQTEQGTEGTTNENNETDVNESFSNDDQAVSDITFDESGTSEIVGNETADQAGGWMTGWATAYGATGIFNGAPTAGGGICNDESMGVAIPMSWPNYSSYYGRTVEISYGGRTVYATINDCGEMAGGAVSLDLQPGVYKALGFATEYEWGKREVSYRIL